MKTTSMLCASLLASPAFAHPGHVERVAGHDHWSLVAGLALIAVAIALPFAVRALRRR